jgi:hypothetical protein
VTFPIWPIGNATTDVTVIRKYKMINFSHILSADVCYHVSVCFFRFAFLSPDRFRPYKSILKG